MRQKRPSTKFGWWWLRTKSKILRYRTPLLLRGTITRLRHHHKRPYLALLRLCLPTAPLTWKYPLPKPVPPLDFIKDPQLAFERRCEGMFRNLEAIPIWRSRDTPLRSLYRLYEAIIGGDEMLPVVGYETEYFFFQSRRSWKLSRIPDPQDPDPIRYAILASIVEGLLESFNFRLSVGLRRDYKHVIATNEGYAPYDPELGPSWPKHVLAVDKQYLRDTMPQDMLDSKGRLVLHEGVEDGPFVRRNIIATEHKFWTI